MCAMNNQDSHSDRAEQGGDHLPAGAELLHGQYRIEKFLNSGGFGMTYIARNSLDRAVVIKECFPTFMCYRKGENVAVRSKEYAKDFRSLADLFRAEARALAGLNHPNIVGVHEVFDYNATAYMALDYVEGRDLQEIVEEDRERLGPIALREILVKVLGAVSYIHERGILHRDISPDNILIDRRNNPVLIDFGSAREAASAAHAETRLQSVKDGYSPHEFYSQRMHHSAASDLYALGATFYFAITGEAPPPSQYRLGALIEKRNDPYQRLSGAHAQYGTRLLKSIDDSLAIIARDRPQSARDWLLAIDDESRKVAALEKARTDARIEQLVRDLVEQTNCALKEEAEEAQRSEKAAKQLAKTEIKVTRRENPSSKDEAYSREEKIRPTGLTDHENEMSVLGESEDTGETFTSGEVDDILQPQPSTLPSVQARKSERAIQAAIESLTGNDSAVTAHSRKRARRSFEINWYLPPLFVSNPTQLAGSIKQ